MASHVAARFLCVLTYKFACDKSVVVLMRSRTVGNSAASVMKKIEENHEDESLNAHVRYLGDYESYRTGKRRLQLDIRPCETPPPVPMLASRQWLLATYVKDVHHRMPGLKNKLTDVYGQIIKMDSTKKLAKKLSGQSSKSAAWVTKVGNEHGQVLICFYRIGIS